MSLSRSMRVEGDPDVVWRRIELLYYVRRAHAVLGKKIEEIKPRQTGAAT